jgi:repressor LexA
MKKNNNEKQQMILDFVNKQVEEKGYPPSVREICSAVGFKSTSTVHAYLEKLEKDGQIIKDATKPRALKVIESSNTQKKINQTEYLHHREQVDVPVIGKITAGEPILAFENVTDTFPVPLDFLGNSDGFMLKVQGESMIEAGILDKDFVLVRQQSVAKNGEIVVALIGDEATVKTFYKEKDYYRLQPENQYMEPIIVKENLSILGKVVGVFRKLS